MGTAGALYCLRKRINNFILVNGDTFLEIDLKKLIKSCDKKSYGSLALVKNHSYRSNKKLNSIELKKIR